MLAELTDYTSAGVRFTGSDRILKVRDQFTPHPIRFHQVWRQHKGEKAMFAWEPIPPNENFVALGMVVTTSDTAPPVDCIRVVPRRWTKKSQIVPRLVWNDAGTGGRPGSIWIINEMGLIWITSGHDAPPGPFYNLKKPKFFVGGAELDPVEKEENAGLKRASTGKQKGNMHMRDSLNKLQKKKSLTPAEANRIRAAMLQDAKGLSHVNKMKTIDDV